MLREADPQRRAQKFRDAINNPELDEALAAARAAGVPGLGPPVRRPRVKEPSPWAQHQEMDVDKADLPSAAVMPVISPTAVPTARRDPLPPARMPQPLRRALVTCAGAFVAVIAAYLLLLKPERSEPTTVSPSASTSVHTGGSVATPAETASPQPILSTPAVTSAPSISSPQADERAETVVARSTAPIATVTVASSPKRAEAAPAAIRLPTAGLPVPAPSAPRQPKPPATSGRILGAEE
jgi:hypothetical protein